MTFQNIASRLGDGLAALARAYRAAYRGLPRAVWLLSLVLLVNRAGATVITFLALYLTQELGHPVTVAGWMLSLYGVGHVAGALAGGWLCDRIGPVRVQILSLVGSGLGWLALGQVRGLVGFGAVVLFTAALAEAFRPANSAALAAVAPDGLQTRAVALNRMALNLGFAVGPSVGGALAAIDYRWLFRVDAATSLLAAAVLATLAARGQLGAADARPSRAAPPAPCRPAPGAAGCHPLHDPPFLGFLAVALIFAFCFFQLWGTYPIFLREVYGLRPAAYGGLITVNALLILAFEVVLTHRAERFRPLAVVGFGSFLIGASFLVLLFGHGLAAALLSTLVWTAGEMLCIPFAGGFVALRAGARHRGRYMGLYTMAWGLAGIAAPAAGTWVYATAGANALWLSLGGLGAVAWVVSLGLDRRLRRLPAIAAVPSAS